MMEVMDLSSHVQHYLYPLFGVTTEAGLIRRMTLGTLLYAFAVFFWQKPAPYGRHRPASWYVIPASLGWLLQESPSCYVPLLLCLTGHSPAIASTANRVLLGLWVLHYAQRSFVYPLVMRSRNKMPLLPCIAAFVTTWYNGILQGVYFGKYRRYDDVWLSTPLFWVGIVVFFFGMYINISSDTTLCTLRKLPGTGYSIPTGGMFQYVSCANYLGEVVQMWGFALASCAPTATAHALFTSCFLLRRATQTHRWYQEKFDNYPNNRKAIIPFLF